MNWNSQKRGHFLYHLLCPKEICLKFVFYLNVWCTECTFRIYILLHIKNCYFIHFFCLFLKLSEAFSVSLRLSNFALFLHLADLFIDIGIGEMNIRLVNLDQLFFPFHLDHRVDFQFSSVLYVTKFHGKLGTPSCFCIQYQEILQSFGLKKMHENFFEMFDNILISRFSPFL